MDLSVSAPHLLSEGMCPPNRKQKHCVFLKSWALCPLLSAGIHTQNAVNEFACTLEQLAQAARPQGRSWRHVPEAPRAAREFNKKSDFVEFCRSGVADVPARGG